ncbi:MAG: hypothetical protein OXU20_26205 [Myxococcales bacterium]|nr:hypothetical protein [Myxococcales bacterium]
MVPLLAGLVVGCAGRQVRPTTPSGEVVTMEEMRIVARDGQGGRTIESYDAADLFARATDLLNAEQCDEAVPLYDRLVAEFPASRYLSPALYNAGLCLQAVGRFEPSAERYRSLRRRLPKSPDYRDASFQFAEVLVQLERFDEVIEVADELLALSDLTSDERLEAMARRGQGLLGTGDVDQAQKYARGALAYYRTRTEADAVADEFFVAASNYVLAETHRIKAQAMSFPEGTEEQRKILIRRAELLLEAQREYFNTMRLTHLDNFHWSSAALYRIGHMYDELWHAVMGAPLPPELPPEGERPYRQELAKLIKPLMRHAIRYWEMTLLYFDDKGVHNRWTEQTKKDLARVRELMLEQPPGPGGLPAEVQPSPTEAPPREPSHPKPARGSV